MAKSDIDAVLAQAAGDAESGPDARITATTTVTRGHGRSKVLQIRLNDSELAELERVAEGRGLPPSTVAREAILRQLFPDVSRKADAARLLEDFTRFVSEYGVEPAKPEPRRPARVSRARFAR